MQVYVLKAEYSSTDANRLCGTLLIKVILCGRDTKSKLKGYVCSVSNRICIEELETGLFIKGGNAAWVTRVEVGNATRVTHA